jgi:hypothetical protein
LSIPIKGRFPVWRIANNRVGLSKSGQDVATIAVEYADSGFLEIRIQNKLSCYPHSPITLPVRSVGATGLHSGQHFLQNTFSSIT